MDVSAVVHLPHIDQLPATSASDVLGQLLAEQGFPSSLDRVHLVAGAGDAGGQVVDAGRAGHFEDQVLATETEAWQITRKSALNLENERGGAGSYLAA